MVSGYVAKPYFSVAPAVKPGIAIKSNLGTGYGTPKYLQKKWLELVCNEFDTSLNDAMEQPAKEFQNYASLL